MKLNIKGLALLAGTVALIAFAVMWALGSGAPRIPENISLQTVDGQSLNLDSLKGKPYLLEFWSTSCSGCVKEIPHLITVQNAFKDSGFTVVGVSMSYDEIPQIQAMRSAKGMNYPLAYDQSGVLAQQFGVRVTPTSLLVDESGKIVFQKMGEWSNSELEGKLQTLIKG